MTASEPIISDARHPASSRGRLPVAVLLSVAAHLLLGVALGSLWLRLDHPSEAAVSLSVRIANVAVSNDEKSRPLQPEQKPRPRPKPRQTRPQPPVAKPKPARPSPPPRPKPAPARPQRVMPPIETSRTTPAPPPAVEQAATKKPQPSKRPSAETPPAAQPAQSAPRPSPPSGGQAESAIADYRAAVRNGIEQNKRYPRRERRRRHQGRSVVAFTIGRDGSIAALRVVESSGVPSLDDAAMAAVRKIDGRFPIPPETGREQWRFSVPIVFRLR